MNRIPSKSSMPTWFSTPSREPSNLPQDTPSESSETDTSEDDTNEEDDWDSGKCFSLYPGKDEIEPTKKSSQCFFN